MATKLLLILLPFGILSYEPDVVEIKPPSNPIKVDAVVLNNIYNGKFIGCKYQSLCPVDRMCYNDLLFGTCLRRDEDANFIYELVAEFQNILELAMSDLFDKKYKWGDFYTQCFLQTALISSEVQQFLDVRHCKPQIPEVVAPTYLPIEPRNNEVYLEQDNSNSRSPQLENRDGSEQINEEPYDIMQSLSEKIEQRKRSDSIYRNSEVINPKSNSEEAISTTKVNYADPNVIRKVLKVAKREPTEWIWLRFDKK